jgi:uncharacterized protein (DUF1501 family)
MRGASRIVVAGGQDGLSPVVKAAHAEYDKFGGQVVLDNVTVRLWDHRRNCHVLCRGTVISVGKPPPVKPVRLKKREADGIVHPDARRIHRYLQRVNAATPTEIARGLTISAGRVRSLLSTHADLFEARRQSSNQTWYGAR